MSLPTSSLDSNQRIWIGEEQRKQLFNELITQEINEIGECNTVADVKAAVKKVREYAFSAENLERYCFGDTGAFDYAYNHIRSLLKKEYKEWLSTKNYTHIEDRIKEIKEYGEINPCPFCGGRATLGNSFWEGVSVYCTYCNASTDTFYDDKDIVAKQRAINAWNRRMSNENSNSNVHR